MFWKAIFCNIASCLHRIVGSFLETLWHTSRWWEMKSWCAWWKIGSAYLAVYTTLLSNLFINFQHLGILHLFGKHSCLFCCCICQLDENSAVFSTLSSRLIALSASPKLEQCVWLISSNPWRWSHLHYSLVRACAWLDSGGVRAGTFTTALWTRLQSKVSHHYR